MSKNNRRFKFDLKKTSKNSVPDHDHPHDHPHDYPLGSEIKLTTEEQASLTKIHEAIAANKNLIYELSLQIHKLEEQLNSTLSVANTSQTELFKIATEIARAKGIDIDDPAKGKWNLDINKMVFTKLT